mmetsp:Transcript_86600/g.253465  ORF Transcript_86600/g.253465 Transcript_86600/m.253465 type:complete len:259 (-) Transcript_86600:203-979(-)
MAYQQQLQQLQQQQFVEPSDGTLTSYLHDAKLVRADSMDIKNDPRFFTGNVLDKRLAAFGCLSVVSGLMVQNAMAAAFDMRKDMDFTTMDGLFQFVGFVLLCGVLYGNVLSTYVGVVQPYHTYRLMTAGPTGFEMACAYYLNREIVGWRHFSIKLMLISMPVFIMSSGFRFVVKFDRDMSTSPELPSSPPLAARLEGLVACAIFMAVGFGLFHIHWRHGEIFRAMYETIYNASGVSNLLSQVDTMMSHRGLMRSPLDV